MNLRPKPVLISLALGLLTAAACQADGIRGVNQAGATGGQPPLTVTFAQQPARVGDRAAQTIGIGLEVSTSITQGGQPAHQGKNSMQRRQQRFVEVVEVQDGTVRRAHVSYPIARMVTSENDEAENEQIQPVEQKTYLVTREGDRLLVTETDGSIPAQAEFEIVVTGLQHLGRPNPLAKFLVGRQFAVGDQIQLPRGTAEQLMGLGGDFGSVEEFTLQLRAVREIEGQRCAVFSASIKAVGEPENPVRIQAFGNVIIQTETCRTVSAEISGPMTLSVVENTPQGDFQYKAQGSMRLAVKSQYGFAPQ